MKRVWWIAAGCLVSAWAWADDVRGGPDARAAVKEALDVRATLPATPPQLPEAASERAREIHATTAFGKKGEQQKAARALAAKQAEAHARQASAANRAGGATAAEVRKGNSDNRAALAHERTARAKEGAGGRGPGGPGTRPSDSTQPRGSRPP